MKKFLIIVIVILFATFQQTMASEFESLKILQENISIADLGNIESFSENDALHYRHIFKSKQNAINSISEAQLKKISKEDETLKYQILIYSKLKDIDKLSTQDVFYLGYFIGWFDMSPDSDEYNFKTKQLQKENVNIVNLAYIIQLVNFDEPVSMLVEEYIFDREVLDNEFIINNQFNIYISDLNNIMQNLYLKGKYNKDDIIKSIQHKTKLRNDQHNKMQRGQAYGVILYVLGMGMIFVVPILLSVVIIIIIALVVIIKKIKSHKS